MPASTLLISLEGIAVEGVQEVVQARGIDKVIVVGSSSGFNADAIAAINAATLQEKGVAVQLAVADAGELNLDAASINAVRNSGLSFLNDPGLASLTGAMRATNDFTETPSIATELPSYTPGDVLDGGLATGADSGGVPLVTLPGDQNTGAGSAIETLSDFNGTVKINLSAKQFADLLRNDGLNEVLNPAGITIDAPQAATVNEIFRTLTVSSVAEFTGVNQIGNLTSFGSQRDTPGTEESNNYWSSGGSLSATRVLTLPEMGVAPYQHNVALRDTAANLRVVLPQLSSGQLASFNSIVVTDNQPLNLDAATLKRLDTASQTASWSNQRGASVINAAGDPATLVVAGSFDELVGNGLLDSSGARKGAIAGNAGVNLLSQALIKVKAFEVSDLADLDLLQTLQEQTNVSVNISSFDLGTPQMSAAEFLEFVASGPVLPTAAIKLVDTPAAIKEILLSADESVIAARTSTIAEFASTNSPAAIELTVEQFIEAAGGSYQAADDFQYPVNNLFDNLGNIELVVSGTAEELNMLFAEFGENFEAIVIGVRFSFTDGGDDTLNASKLYVLKELVTGDEIVEQEI